MHKMCRTGGNRDFLGLAEAILVARGCQHHSAAAAILRGRLKNGRAVIFRTALPNSVIPNPRFSRCEACLPQAGICFSVAQASACAFLPRVFSIHNSGIAIFLATLACHSEPVPMHWIGTV